MIMRRFMPPSIRSFDSQSSGGSAALLAPIREAAFRDGYSEGQRVGHAAGVTDGAAQARAEMEETIAILRAALDQQSASDNVGIAVTQLLDMRNADILLIESRIRAALAAAVDILFPSLMAHTIGPDLARLVGDALTDRSPDTLTIRASGETIGCLAATGAAELDATRLTYVPNEDQPFGAVEVTWAGGGLTFDPIALLHDVTEAISPITLRKDKEDA